MTAAISTPLTSIVAATASGSSGNGAYEWTKYMSGCSSSEPTNGSSGLVRSSLQPTFGIRVAVSPSPRSSRRTAPGIKPSPRWDPNSSLLLASSCMPRQIPSRGISRSAALCRTSTRPRDSSPRIASANAPTPGSTTRSAARITSGSDVIVGCAPTFLSAWPMLKRLPRP